MSAAQKAAVLAEALPGLNRFAGRTIVVKYGGHAMDDAVARRAFADDVALLHRCGVRIVVVHGGGPQVTRQLDRLGVESAFSHGRRVTTPEVLDVVRMVLVGQVNRDIVGLLNAHGPLAVGLSGEDARLFSAIQLDQELGLVGEVDEVDPGIVRTLLADGRVPVVATVALGPEGVIYNVNADTAAAALAVALCAEKLVVLTDVAGLFRTYPDPDTLIPSIGADELEALLPSLDAGMVPKMEACLRAVRGGLPETRVLDGRVPHALLFEVFTDAAAGTTVTP